MMWSDRPLTKKRHQLTLELRCSREPRPPLGLASLVTCSSFLKRREVGEREKDGRRREKRRAGESRGEQERAGERRRKRERE
jgi:hypothetical protein